MTKSFRRGMSETKVIPLSCGEAEQTVERILQVLFKLTECIDNAADKLTRRRYHQSSSSSLFLLYQYSSLLGLH